MNDYHRYLDNQYQENINEDIEMSPNSEINPSHNGILPPVNIHMNMNLTVQNPEVQNLSLNNQSNQNDANAKKAQSGSMNNNGDTQMNREQESSEFESNCLFNMNYDGDDKLNMEFYPDLSKVEVNKSSTCYQLTENPGTELAEQSAQEQTIHIMRVDDATLDETMRHN